MKKYIKTSIAEMLGTFVFVLFGCGVGIATSFDLIATSLAFGTAFIAMYYALGKVSGCQLNPATSVALFINKKIDLKSMLISIVSQIVGALIGVLGIYLVTNQRNTFMANQVQATIVATRDTKTMQYLIAFLVEVILTFVLIYTTLAVKEKDEKIAGIVIGMALILITLLGFKLTFAGANPAKSLATALFQKDHTALKQVWIFILAPLLGGVIGAFTFKLLNKEEIEE